MEAQNYSNHRASTRCFTAFCFPCWRNVHRIRSEFGQVSRRPPAALQRLADRRAHLRNSAPAALRPDLRAEGAGPANPGGGEPAPFRLTGKLPDSRLSIRQIIGLRFASDDELVALAKRAADENLSEDEIKRAIKNWKADTYRV